MKVIIAGSRSLYGVRLVEQAVKASGFDVTEVISGGASGIDYWGAQWARNRGIPVTEMLAEWHEYGKKAGSIRNRQMCQYGEAAIVVWEGISPGSRNMIAEATRKGLPLYVHRVANKAVAQKEV